MLFCRATGNMGPNCYAVTAGPGDLCLLPCLEAWKTFLEDHMSISKDFAVDFSDFWASYGFPSIPQQSSSEFVERLRSCTFRASAAWYFCWARQALRQSESVGSSVCRGRSTSSSHFGGLECTDWRSRGLGRNLRVCFYFRRGRSYAVFSERMRRWKFL